MSIKGKTPSPATSSPMLKNVGAAPVVYFDGVPVFGTFSGNIEIELAARMLMPKPDGTVVVDMACTAHLRCSRAAAEMLINVLQHSIAMLDQAALDQANPGEKDAPLEQRPN
jgi:hypothetical protein